MFKRLRDKLRGSAATQQTPPPPADPVQLMHDDLARCGFAQEAEGGKHAFTREAPGRVLVVMNRDGDGLPTPDDWSVGVYDTGHPSWPDRPSEAVTLYSRDNLPADFIIVMTAALAQIPRGA